MNAGRPRTVHCSSCCSPKGLHSLTWETLSRGFRGQHGEGSGGDPASPAAPRRRPARSAPPTARTIRLASCRVGSSFGARTASPRLLSAADDASGPNGPETVRGGRSPASIQGRETSRCESCTQERCTALESGADSALAGPALGPSARSGTGALRPHVEADWRRRGPRGRGEGRGPIQGGGPLCCEMPGVLAVEARDTARQRPRTDAADLRAQKRRRGWFRAFHPSKRGRLRECRGRLWPRVWCREHPRAPPRHGALRTPSPDARPPSQATGRSVFPRGSRRTPSDGLRAR